MRPCNGFVTFKAGNLDRDVHIVPFKFKHLSLLQEMLESQHYQNVESVSMKSLPKIGYIALLNKEPIAAGFLRRIEGGFAQLDGLTSNAFFGSLIRHQGVSKVVESLLEDARNLKLKGVLAYTKDKSVVKRALIIGFNVVDQTVLSIKI